ncbi:MAG TPA: hypothetical protein VHD56_16235 [Tepidisphaeraceae bacterium]|nr:hypothetical protein [Tepidisphaeraceae bacterium]
MSHKDPANSTLGYANGSGLAPRPKSLLEITGFHFVVGLGIATVLSVTLLFMFGSRDYPLTTGCGGTFVVLIEAGLLAVGAACRQAFSGRLLEERKASLTVAAGVLGGALVFGLPIAVSRFSNNEAVYAVSTLLPLCVYPLLATGILFVPSGFSGRRAI